MRSASVSVTVELGFCVHGFCRGVVTVSCVNLLCGVVCRVQLEFKDMGFPPLSFSFLFSLLSLLSPLSSLSSPSPPCSPFLPVEVGPLHFS